LVLTLIDAGSHFQGIDMMLVQSSLLRCSWLLFILISFVTVPGCGSDSGSTPTEADQKHLEQMLDPRMGMPGTMLSPQDQAKKAMESAPSGAPVPPTGQPTRP
jgi:hypothetical protein